MGQSVDVGAARWAAVDALDELKHLAKVRVASSIPVFRSKMAGQGSIFNPMSPPLTRTLAFDSSRQVSHRSVVDALTIFILSREAKLSLMGGKNLMQTRLLSSSR